MQAEPNTVYLWRRPPGKKPYLLGMAMRSSYGWKFRPDLRVAHITGRRVSAKFWPTWEAALPSWVGYPDECESTLTPEPGWIP